jgi:hypothetical protein
LEALDFSGTRLETIEANLAGECTNLRKVLFPSTLKEIDAGCFGNSGLKALDFSGTRLERVGSCSAHGSPDLSEVLLPGTLRVLGDRCFENYRQPDDPRVAVWIIYAAAWVGGRDGLMHPSHRVIFSGRVCVCRQPTRPIPPRE